MTVSGDPEGLHVETSCCITCGIPWTYAPEIFREGDHSCLVIRQPRTATEARRVLRVFQGQEADCVRYGGANPRIVAILGRARIAPGPGQSPPRVDARRITPPLAVRLVLAVFFWASATLAVGGLSRVSPSNWGSMLYALAGGVGLLLTHSAWQRRGWGFWGLLLLAGIVDAVEIAAHVAGHRSSVLVPMLFTAAALGLLFSRGWYAATQN